MFRGPKLLREWMQSVGAGQTGLARALGISRGALIGYLDGSMTPGVSPAVAIERKTGGTVPVEAWVDEVAE